MVSIFSHTRDSYAKTIYSLLNRGYDHASLIYQEWYRTGCVTGANPAFNNAQTLFKEILDLTDFSLLEMIRTTEENQTGKFLLKTKEKLEIESVIIPMQAGGTLCVSSQVGCRMGCAFCETGRMGLLKNLSASEIVSQVFVARFQLKASIRNIVFMGMGEPFDNYDEVMQAVKVLSDPYGFGFGSNHITISTSGCIEGIEKLMHESVRPNLAVSISAPNNTLRNKLMPINRKQNLDELHEVMKRYFEKTGKEILISYVLLKGKNDALEQADELASYLTGLSVKINLIPYNPQSRDHFEPPAQMQIDAFATRLRSHGFYTLLRQTKGQKIMAACGQLGNLQLRLMNR